MATITGNNSANTLTGTAAADTIAGRGGNDRLAGLGGNDRLLGETGNDVLEGGIGADSLDGGPGSDVATYVSLGSAITARSGAFLGDGGTTWSVTSATGEVDTLAAIEGVVGTRFADTFRGGDRVADLMRGGAGDDEMYGGFLSAGSDTIYGGDGNDLITGGEETIEQRGGAVPGTGDRLFGGNGNDTLYGVDGDDRLVGDAGDDRLSGGPDRDVLTGGAGRDKFTFYNIVPDPQDQTFGDFGLDLITDFARGQDRLLVVAGDPYDEGAQLDSFAELDSNRNGVLDGGDLYVDVEPVAFGGTTRTSTVIDVTDYPGGVGDDGSGQGAFGPQSITVFGVTGLRATDFTFDLF